MDEELGSFYSNTEGEYHYFKLREKKGPDVLFVSKETKFTNSITRQVTSKRYIRKVVHLTNKTWEECGTILGAQRGCYYSQRNPIHGWTDFQQNKCGTMGSELKRSL